jgi:hypothetical protein
MNLMCQKIRFGPKYQKIHFDPMCRRFRRFQKFQKILKFQKNPMNQTNQTIHCFLMFL